MRCLGECDYSRELSSIHITDVATKVDSMFRRVGGVN